MKAVVDCNVFISVLIAPGGPPARILSALLRKEFELVLSPAIFAEFRRTLDYPKIKRRLPYSARELKDLEEDLLVLSIWVEPASAPQPLVAADPDDDAYLLAAVESQADHIVSGDRHLLALGEFEGIEIVSPRDFLSLLAKS